MDKENKSAVIGTVFMDIKGFSRSKYDPVGTNIGDVYFIHGGVGRNAAENLANIGIPVSFVSTVDLGSSGDDIIRALNRCGADTSYVLRTEADGMGLWLAVLDEKGELAGSISKQPNMNIFESYIENIIYDVVENCSAVVLEIDMTRKIAEMVILAANKASKPVYALVGNMNVVLQSKELLSKTDCFICNNIEAAKLMEKEAVDVSAFELVKEIGDSLKLQSVVVTNGADGAYYYDRISGVTGHQRAVETVVKDSTGAGDAFFSGTVGALIKGFSLKKACEFGARLSAEVLASTGSAVEKCPDFYNR